MKKILITGAAGFIGLHLAKKLSGYCKVDLIDNFHRGKKDYEFKKIIKQKNVSFINYDLSKKIRIKKQYDFIFHLAALVGVNNVISRPYDVLKKNFQLLDNIMQFSCKQKKLKRIFFFSTSEVYAGSIDSKLIKFPTPEKQLIALPKLSNKRSSYLLSKIYGEALCLHSNLPFIIIRPHNIYGPRMGNAHVIPQLIQKIKKKGKFFVFNPLHKRTFCFIDDFINCIIYLMNRNKLRHQIYNIGNPNEEIKIKDLAKKIMKHLKIKKKIYFKNLDNSSPNKRIPDVSRLKKEIKFNKLTKLDKGIDQTVNWYIQNFK